MIELIEGDCMEWLALLPEKSADLVLADLPYGTTRCAWDSVLPLDQLWPLLKRVARGPIVMFAQTPFDKVLGASNLPMLRYEWIWEKAQATGHLNAQRQPMKAHENVLVFYEKPPTYNPQKTEGHARKRAAKRGDTSTVYGAQNRPLQVYDSSDRYPRSVQLFAKDTQREKLHPTQKPVALCEYLIRTYTNAGDVVLDPTMGSGSAGAASVNAGRRFVGIEQDPGFFAVAKERISETR